MQPPHIRRPHFRWEAGVCFQPPSLSSSQPCSLLLQELKSLQEKRNGKQWSYLWCGVAMIWTLRSCLVYWKGWLIQGVGLNKADCLCANKEEMTWGEETSSQMPHWVTWDRRATESRVCSSTLRWRCVHYVLLESQTTSTFRVDNCPERWSPFCSLRSKRGKDDPVQRVLICLRALIRW